MSPLVWDSEEARTPAGDMLLIRSPWDYMIKAEALRDWLVAMSEGGYPVLNAPDRVLWNLDKHYLGELGGQGIPIIPTEYIEAEGAFDAGEYLARFDVPELIVKPVVSANAYGTYRVSSSNIDDLDNDIQTLVGRQAVMVQPFLPEILEDGEWSLVFFGRDYSHGFRKLPGPGDFRVQEEHGGATIVEPVPADVIAASKAIVEGLDFTPFYARVDGVRTNGAGGGEFLLMELEMFEPELYFRAGPEIAPRFADVIEEWLQS